MSEAPKFQRPLCAVVDCIATPKPQLCPADGQYHHHGHIHFEHCHSNLEIRRDGVWHDVCDGHYAAFVAARMSWVEKKRAGIPCSCPSCERERLAREADNA